MLNLKRETEKVVREDVEKSEPHSESKKVKWCGHLGKQFGVP